MNRPTTRRQELVEKLHDVEVADPYRWLEDGDAAEVAAWTRAQNAHTRAVLDTTPGRDYLRARLEELLAIGVVTAPKVRGERHFYTRRSGRQNQPVLLVREGFSGPERVLLDPNAAHAGGTIALDWWYPSPDGSLLAFGYSDHGDEWSTLYVIDVASGEMLSEAIPYTRYCSIAWLPDSSGFYYTRYPTPGTVPPGEEQYHRHAFFHTLGSDPAADPHVFGQGRNMLDTIELHLSEDGRYLLVVVNQAWTRSELFLAEVDGANPALRPVITGQDALFEADFGGDTIYCLTNWHAPLRRVVAIDPAKPDPANWRELIPTRADTSIEALALIGGRIVLNALRDVASHAEIYALDGTPQGEIPLPPLSSITGLGGSFGGEHIFVGYESYIVPPTVVSYSAAEGAKPWAAAEMPLDASKISVEQVWYSSRDGTRIPMIVTRPAGLRMDGSTPTVLTGYGGFNLSKVPAFTRYALAWVEMGGVFAVANLRGGAEYGEAWHRAGMRGNKQNVFDDFIAAGEYLIAKGYTSRNHLGIWGRSNGGLLVGAAEVQRPDLFKAVVSQVPLLDMVRYHQFRLAKLWVDEYGSPDEPEDFAWLHAYSPYHNVNPEVAYPATFLTTAWSDSRVDPLHARKMTALLQATSPNPVLLFVEDEAGHGQGKPLGKLIDEMTDVWGFLAWQLGLEAPTA